MPQVPYQPYSTEQPISGTGAKGISIAAPVEAFGGATAAALQHLGQVTQQSGDELFSRAVAMQDLKNRTEANDLAIDAEMAMSDAYTKFASLQGKNAVGAQAGFNESLKQIQKDYSGRGSNPEVTRMVDMQTKGTMARTIFSGGRHAATEQKTWTKQSALDGIALNNKQVLDNPKDELEFQRRRAESERLTRVLTQVEGLDEVSTKRMVFESNSKSRAAQLDGMIREAPLTATGLVDKYKSELTEDDYKRLHAQALTKVQQVVPENVAQETFAGGQETDKAPAKTLKEMETEVETKLNAQYPNDPIMAKTGVASIQRIFNQDKYAKAQQAIENNQTIDAAIIQAEPKTVQELTAINDKVNAAYNLLPKDQQMKMQGRLNKYNADVLKMRNEAEWGRLEGLKENDVGAFLDEDILDNALLTKQDKMRFVGEQQKKRAQTTADPRVARDHGWMQSAFPKEMEALGIYRRTQDNKDDFDRYTGMFQQSLEAWRDAHGKPADYEAVTKVIGPQVIRKVSEPGFWNRITGGLIPTTNERAFFNVRTVPEDWKAKWTAKQIAAGETPTEDADQLLREYTRYLAIEMFGSREQRTGAVPVPRGPR